MNSADAATKPYWNGPGRSSSSGGAGCLAATLSSWRLAVLPPWTGSPSWRGRPRLNGKRRPSLEAVVADEKLQWTKLTIEDWYGEGPRAVDVTTDTAVWYHSGKPPVAIRWGLIRDPQARFKPQALLSTNLAHTCEQILAWFVRRWTMAVTWEEARDHLGREPPSQWNERAIALTTQALV